jgi:addiction module HigA family antidote
MAMHNPPHPGEFIIKVNLDPNNLSGRELAGKLDVAASTLNRILMGTSHVSPKMALRLSRAVVRMELFASLPHPPSGLTP